MDPDSNIVKLMEKGFYERELSSPRQLLVCPRTFVWKEMKSRSTAKFLSNCFIENYAHTHVYDQQKKNNHWLNRENQSNVSGRATKVNSSKTVNDKYNENYGSFRNGPEQVCKNAARCSFHFEFVQSVRLYQRVLVLFSTCRNHLLK